MSSVGGTTPGSIPVLINEFASLKGYDLVLAIENNYVNIGSQITSVKHGEEWQAVDIDKSRVAKLKLDNIDNKKLDEVVGELEAVIDDPIGLEERSHVIQVKNALDEIKKIKGSKATVLPESTKQAESKEVSASKVEPKTKAEPKEELKNKAKQLLEKFDPNVYHAQTSPEEAKMRLQPDQYVIVDDPKSSDPKSPQYNDPSRVYFLLLTKNFTIPIRYSDKDTWSSKPIKGAPHEKATLEAFRDLGEPMPLKGSKPKEEEVKGSEEVSGSKTFDKEKEVLRGKAKKIMEIDFPNTYHENIPSDALKSLQQSLQPGQYVIIDDPVMAAKFEKKGSPHVYFKIHIKDQENVIRPISIRYGENGWSSLMLRAWYSMESLKEVLG